MPAIGHSAAEKADHRHPLLLRLRRKRPRDCRASKKGDESATLHVHPKNQEMAYWLLKRIH